MVDYMNARGMCPDCGEFRGWSDGPPHRCWLDSFDMVAQLTRQKNWSLRTFGPGSRAAGVVAHIRKELCEIEAAPKDLSEWIDVAILAFDGAWRAGYSPEEIAGAYNAKHRKNEAREWPDWRTMPDDQPIEHDRSKD